MYCATLDLPRIELVESGVGGRMGVEESEEG